MLYVLTLMVMIIAHSYLCYPVAISRGHPPLSPFWHVAVYLAFLGVGLAPAFEDFADFRQLRIFMLVTFTMFACIILAIATTNISTARPHIGSLAGYWAVVRYDWPAVILYTLKSAAIAVPFVLCYESVARGFWNAVRKFQNNATA
ncbi:MAG TPA: hypothetical protein EYQ63_27875 [Fuerstia sp.]|nr:hypothetical protein [Fuerstiella sp.]